ncbi:hypothetical protein SCHIN_v1c06420 [Spiroplasma chinense]|uniref:Lipoprotein n=1 Tax=Spiroplasma chinense TaxID=216932 RepID=A0A5B9Y569_9MOLU|nr:lipoprotein [Spiroplasma chinense]QEH61839.1 hypothetical protein SCHIN_v1c06420 [Spiroplasma chinense]
MKKLLSIFTALSVTVSTASSVVACDNGNEKSNALTPSKKGKLGSLSGTKVHPGMDFIDLSTAFSKIIFSKYSYAGIWGATIEIQNTTDNTNDRLEKLAWNKEYKAIPFSVIGESYFEGEYVFNTKNLTLNDAFNEKIAPYALIGTTYSSSKNADLVEKLFGWKDKTVNVDDYFNVSWDGSEDPLVNYAIKDGSKVQVKALQDHEATGLKKDDSFEYTFKKIKISNLINDTNTYRSYIYETENMFKSSSSFPIDTLVYLNTNFKNFLTLENLSSKGEIQGGTIVKINTEGVEGIIEKENTSVKL